MLGTGDDLVNKRQVPAYEAYGLARSTDQKTKAESTICQKQNQQFQYTVLRALMEKLHHKVPEEYLAEIHSRQ